MEYVLSNTSVALLGYIALTLIILLILASFRTSLAVRGKRRPNDFSPTGEDVGPFSRRLVRAHANLYEFFPIYGGLLLFSLITEQTDITNGLALVFLGARIFQTLIHISSTSIMAVQIRFFFFLTQFFIAIYWVLNFLGVIG